MMTKMVCSTGRRSCSDTGRTSIKASRRLSVSFASWSARPSADLAAFGYGRSYTTFEWTDAKVTQTASQVDIEVTVKNTGSHAGRDVLQVYVSKGQDEPRKLEAIAKTFDLAPGSSETLRVSLQSRAFARRSGSSWTVGEGIWRVSLSSDVESEKIGLDVYAPRA